MKQKVIKILKRNQLSLVLYVSAFLIGLCFVIPLSGWPLLISLPILFYYTELMRKLSFRRVLVDFYIVGFLIIGLAHAFMFQTASENWNAITSGWFIFGSQFITWIIATIVCSAPFIGVGWILYSIKSNQKRLWAVIVVWPVFEMLRAFVFSVISYGKGGAISTNFSFGSIAALVSGTPLVYAVRFLGFWGLSCVALAFGLGIYYVIRRKYLTGTALFAGVLVVTLVAYRLPINGQGKTMKVVAVHLNERDALSQWQNADDLPQDIDLLVLPEYSEALNAAVLSKVASKLSPNGVAVTTVAEGRAPNTRNRLTYFNAQGQIVSEQDKTTLIPTGEYLPWILEKVFLAVRQKVLVDTFTYTQAITPGTAPESVVEYGGVKFGALPCSGAVTLNKYRSLTKQGAEVLINPASLSFLSPDSSYHIYGTNMARYQAVSNRRPFVQASRSGHSFVINAQGRVLKSSQSQQTEVIEYQLNY